MKSGRSECALTRTLSITASLNNHCGSLEMSTVFIAIAYPLLVNVLVGQLK